jgi:hypothetical protein
MITRRMLIAIGAVGLCLLAAVPASATFPGANGRIAFERQARPGGIFTMRPDGSEVQRLQPGSDPSWSPNGRWIVYVCYPEAETYDQICMMRADGSNVRQVTSGGIPASQPEFLPGGGRVLFYREGLHSDPGGMFMINTDGSDEHRVGNAFGGEWAPDGKHIAYVKPGPEIWLMRTDGSGRRLLYSGGFYPRYAPNSRSILFSPSGDPSDDTTMRMGGGGGNPHPINTGPIDYQAQVSPAGGCIFGIVTFPGTGAGSSVYAHGARCPATGFLAGGDAVNPSWQPLP